MSPVAQSRGHAGRALAVAGAGVVVALGIAVAVAVLANRGTVDVKLGTDTFVQQDAEDAAERIAEGGPILYADTAGGDRDIVLQHLGDDPETGWLALAARPPGVPRECTIQSRDRDEPFRLLDPDGAESGNCDGREFAPDGEGLPSYPVTVRDGKLDVDLNAADRATSTTGP
ncbi:MAG TPA: hypothetical protein VFI47_30560 [Acidimicrobiales bacterium]|nr:hypothetical protein [Acidimicrobiales bacterium]